MRGPTGRAAQAAARIALSLLTHPVEWAGGVIMAGITIVVFLQVLTRYVLAYPWEWPEELARMLFVWLALLGAALALRRNGHFGISVVTQRLPPGVQRAARIAVGLALLGFLLLLTYLGVEATLRVREQFSTAMEVSMSYGYAAVPIGCGLMGIEVARQLWRTLTRATG